jgi:hypothetical protein
MKNSTKGKNMDYKIISKLLSRMFLMTPLVSNAWNLVTDYVDGTGKAAYIQAADELDTQKGALPDRAAQATILIKAQAEPGKTDNSSQPPARTFWLYELNADGKSYNPQTTNDAQNSYILPGVPMFMPAWPTSGAGGKFYQYPGGGSMLGKNASEILKPYGDALCCIELGEGPANTFNQVVFYRHNANNKRYFFAAPAAVVHAGLGNNSTGKLDFRVGLNGTIKKKTKAPTQFDDLKTVGNTHFSHLKTYTNREADFEITTLAGATTAQAGKALSGLASQGYVATWRTTDSAVKGNDGKYSLPGIALKKLDQNCLITTQATINGRVLLTHHIFLNEEWTEIFQDALFVEHSDWPEELRTVDTTASSDFIAFCGRLEMLKKLHIDDATAPSTSPAAPDPTKNADYDLLFGVQGILIKMENLVPLPALVSSGLNDIQRKVQRIVPTAPAEPPPPDDASDADAPGDGSDESTGPQSESTAAAKRLAERVELRKQLRKGDRKAKNNAIYQLYKEKQQPRPQVKGTPETLKATRERAQKLWKEPSKK